MYRYGRINRATYLISLAVMVGLYGTLMALMTKPPHIFEVLAILIALPRLHDIGKSGWWAGGAVLAEFVAIFGALALFQSEEAVLITGGFFVIAMLGLMIWLGCISGDPQANAYGDPPPPGFSFKAYRRNL